MEYPQQCAGQRLGVKRFGGQKVSAGEVLVLETSATRSLVTVHTLYVFHHPRRKDSVVGFKSVKKTSLPASGRRAAWIVL